MVGGVPYVLFFDTFYWGYYKDGAHTGKCNRLPYCFGGRDAPLRRRALYGARIVPFLAPQSTAPTGYLARTILS